jgi:hypothetical protein
MSCLKSLQPVRILSAAYAGQRSGGRISDGVIKEKKQNFHVLIAFI